MYKEKIGKLAAKIKDNETLENLRFVEKDFSEYVRTVADTENILTIARFKYQGEEFREYVAGQMLLRKRAMACAVYSIKILNKICLLYDEPVIYTEDIRNTEQIACFCKSVVDELFESRKAA